MNKIQLGIDAISTTTIRIGFEGENVHTQVTFFWTVLRSKYPDAVASLSIKPPVGDIYPKSVTQDGNKVVWDVTASDTANPGSGEYQLTFTDGEEIIKTYIGNFTVNDSIIGDGEAPDPIQDWVADANAVLGELSDISASVTTLEAGESATVEVTEVGGHKNLAFGIPAGEKGEQGEPGEPGDPAPAEEVIPAVNAYLAEVITNPDSPPLDRTLSSSSAAAPADMVGDLKSALDNFENNLGYNNLFDISDIGLITVTGTGTQRVGYDMGNLPAGTYQIDYIEKPDILVGEKLYITTIKNGSYFQEEVTSNNYKFTLTETTHTILRDMFQSVSQFGYLSIDVYNIQDYRVTSEKVSKIEDTVATQLDLQISVSDPTLVIVNDQGTERAGVDAGTLKTGNYILRYNDDNKIEGDQLYITKYQNGVYTSESIESPYTFVIEGSAKVVFRSLVQSTSQFGYSDFVLTTNGEISIKLNQLISNDNLILCVGDSQTQGGQYATTLRNALQNGADVVSFGHGGAGCLGASWFQGGVPIFANPFTIPANTSQVEITLISTPIEGNTTSFMVQSSQGVNPCIIGGIKGTLSRDGNGKYYFERETSGTAKVLSRPEQIMTNAMMNYRDAILVVWLGTNDSFGKTSSDVVSLADYIEAYIRDIIRYNGTEKYIVMGLTAKSYMVAVAEENLELAKRFGSHFLELRRYILDYGLQDAGITPTAQDQTDIANGEIPTSLRKTNDIVHFNDAGYTVIGNLLYKKGIDLGYWE